MDHTPKQQFIEEQKNKLSDMEFFFEYALW